jgi:hypothetical protein
MSVRGIEQRRIEGCEIPVADADSKLGVTTSAISRMIL